MPPTARRCGRGVGAADFLSDDEKRRGGGVWGAVDAQMTAVCGRGVTGGIGHDELCGNEVESLSAARLEHLLEGKSALVLAA